jgi:hypothetical protein
MIGELMQRGGIKLVRIFRKPPLWKAMPITLENGSSIMSTANDLVTLLKPSLRELEPRWLWKWPSSNQLVVSVPDAKAKDPLCLVNWGKCRP